MVSFTVLDSAKIFLEGENSIYQTEVSSDETALVEPLVSAYYAVSSGNVYVGVVSLIVIVRVLFCSLSKSSLAE